MLKERLESREITPLQYLFSLGEKWTDLSKTSLNLSLRVKMMIIMRSFPQLLIYVLFAYSQEISQSCFFHANIATPVKIVAIFLGK